MVKVTSIGHFVGGFIAALVGYYLNPGLAAIATALFIIYELDEDWHISDEAFRDIREYIIGFFAACIALLMARVTGVMAHGA